MRGDRQGMAILGGDIGDRKVHKLLFGSEHDFFCSAVNVQQQHEDCTLTSVSSLPARASQIIAGVAATPGMSSLPPSSLHTEKLPRLAISTEDRDPYSFGHW